MNVKLKAIGFLWLLFCTTETLHAQQGVVSSGGNISSATGSVSYSIGQVMYNHIEGEVGSLNQGVQQPHTFTIVGIEDLQEETTFRLYPNPADQFVHIQLASPPSFDASHHLTARLYDMTGNLITEQSLNQEINTLSLRQCTEAAYIVQILDQQKQIKSYALFKSN
jgi:hypothetical protein